MGIIPDRDESQDGDSSTFNRLYARVRREIGSGDDAFNALNVSRARVARVRHIVFLPWLPASYLARLAPGHDPVQRSLLAADRIPSSVTP